MGLRDEDLLPDADERIFSEILDERRDRRRDVVKKDFLHFLKEIDKLGGKLSEITAGEIEVPVLNDIPTGCPVPVIDAAYLERTEPFPHGWADSERTFGLVIKDDSMDGLGLQAGDTVFINRDDFEVVGQGKVMAVGTKKGLMIRTVVRQGEKYRLIAENPRYETLEDSPDDIFIYGTLIKYVIKTKLS
ncbi:MAG: S24 family peptidase [bacterium]